MLAEARGIRPPVTDGREQTTVALPRASVRTRLRRRIGPDPLPDRCKGARRSRLGAASDVENGLGSRRHLNL